MRHLLSLTVGTLLALSACAPKSEPQSTSSPTSAPPASAEPATPPPTADAPTPDSSASATAPAADVPPAASIGNWTSGTHYQVLSPAQPTNVAPGKIEVLEMFWYGCNHCYALDPYLENWKKTKPANVEFVRVPVTWSALHQQHARMYYVWQALKRPDLHSKIFDLHMQYWRRNEVFGSENEAEGRKMQAEFFRANGVSEKAFNDAYDSFEVDRNIKLAKQLVDRYRVDGVPRIVVNGKYITDVGMARGDANLIKLINDLAAAERG